MKEQSIPVLSGLVEQLMFSVLNDFILVFGWIEEDGESSWIWSDRDRDKGIRIATDAILRRNRLTEEMGVLTDIRNGGHEVEWAMVRPGTVAKVKLLEEEWNCNLNYQDDQLVALKSSDAEPVAISGMTFSGPAGEVIRPALSYWSEGTQLGDHSDAQRRGRPTRRRETSG